MSMPLELTFAETLWSDVIGAFFTAVFVALGAGLVVARFENRAADRRSVAEAERAKALQEADAQRADALLEADRRRADALLVAENRRSELQRLLDVAHDERQQGREDEFQARAALRYSYARLLVAQRRSRQCSLALARATDQSQADGQDVAIEALNMFIDEYHRLALMQTAQ